MRHTDLNCYVDENTGCLCAAEDEPHVSTDAAVVALREQVAFLLSAAISKEDLTAAEKAEARRALQDSEPAYRAAKERIGNEAIAEIVRGLLEGQLLEVGPYQIGLIPAAPTLAADKPKVIEASGDWVDRLIADAEARALLDTPEGSER